MSMRGWMDVWMDGWMDRIDGGELEWMSGWGMMWMHEVYNG